MISIIVPIYNVEKYLPKCVDSLLRQTYTDLEIILVDDGSPDRCPEICDGYAALDARVRVIHQKNSGVSAARNAGLASAKGAWIGFMDPDDWADSTMYEKLLQAMQKYGCELAICGYDYYDESYCVDESRRYPIRESELLDRRELLKRLSDMPPTVRHGVSNKLFPASALKDISFPENLRSSEDVAFLTACMKNVQNAVVVHQPLYQNLVRKGSATHGALKIESLADSFQAHKDMYEMIIAAYPDLKDHSLAFLMDVCLLKYGEAKGKAAPLSGQEKSDAEKRLRQMRRFIKKYAWQALFDKEIYWKTRIFYFIF